MGSPRPSFWIADGVQLHYHLGMKPPYELCYCQAARSSSRFLSRLYDRHLAPAGINIQQMTILSMIFHNPGLAMADLASQMVMDRTTLVRALKPLQNAGFVVSELSGTTGRSLAFTLSRRGVNKLLEARPLWSDAQKEFEKQFGVIKAKSLRSSMKMASAIG